MITRAIVEEVVSQFSVRVRIPLLNSIKSESLSTKTNELNVATICTLPNCMSTPQVGDVVFVAFEDNTYHKAVVIGFLSKEAAALTNADLQLERLSVLGTTVLAKDTTIGEVSATEISMLQGLNGNIQKQLTFLKEQIEVIQAAISNKQTE